MTSPAQLRYQPDQAAWKTGMVEFLRDLRFTHALTLSWNRSFPLPVARQHLRTLHAMVDRRLLGCRYTSKPNSQRTLAAFVFEGLGSGGHLHVHSLWRIDRRNLLPFMQMFHGERGGAWNRIIPSGSYKLSINNDPSVFAGYALKQQHMRSADDEIVWSSEFTPT